MSPSSPPPPSVTTLDEPHTRSVKSILHIRPDNSAEHTTPQPDSPSLSSPSLAPPTLPTSFRSSTVSSSTPMSAVQQKIQPSPSSQNQTTVSISINSDPSCLTPPDPAALLRCDQPCKLSSQPPDSGIVDPVSLSLKPRQSITRKLLSLPSIALQ